MADTHNARPPFGMTYHITDIPSYVISKIHRGFEDWKWLDINLRIYPNSKAMHSNKKCEFTSLTVSSLTNFNQKPMPEYTLDPSRMVGRFTGIKPTLMKISWFKQVAFFWCPCSCCIGKCSILPHNFDALSVGGNPGWVMGWGVLWLGSGRRRTCLFHRAVLPVYHCEPNYTLYYSHYKCKATGLRSLFCI